VDLDGTLVKTDTLVEASLQLLAKRPWLALQFGFWLVEGKANFKERVARNVEFRAGTLPYNSAVLAYLSEQKAAGRTIVLATAAHRNFADAVATHLGLFDAVVATEHGVNLRSANKAELLERRYGRHGFAYIGDSSADAPVWRQAGEVLCVGIGHRVRAALASSGVKIDREFPGASAHPLRSLIRSLRTHQSAKNVLVFVALLASHRVADLHRVRDTILCWLAFSLCSSSAYLINDLLDLEADRTHPTKRNRPFASGDLPVAAGVLLAPAILALGLLLSTAIAPQVTAMLAIYFAVTLLYSIKLKELVLIDVLVLAGLYAWRVLTGAAASSVEVSPWLGAFSLFFFLSLAFVKRYTELLNLTSAPQTVTRRRGYLPVDLEQVRTFGIASGYIAVLVMSMYLNNSSEARLLYRNPARLWLVLPVLIYWISRIWLIAGRNRMHDDPVLFALRDRVSHIAGLAVLAILALAI
jgi:4-hydroxybenzoate polyprenyltransferase/phosphoglycolate phosphatase-like HAD superfamily hydrolase